MPDDQTLASMYGPDYVELFHGSENMGSAANFAEVRQWLQREARGKFIDYGCGAGFVLRAAREAGWNAVGIEFDGKVAGEISKRTGVPVISDPSEIPDEFADVLHLGDVIEHLTDIERQMPEILKLLKAGGLLLAQGPLENNANLFNLSVRLSRRLRPGRRTEMAPYHVLLATAEGQRRFFRRFGLHELSYSISEEAWPAPAKISRQNFTQLRSVGLFILRRCSQSLSAMRPNSWGNRYFYAGRKG
jgi:SAM-dependent methyltransferase